MGRGLLCKPGGHITSGKYHHSILHRTQVWRERERGGGGGGGRDGL